MPNCSFIRDNGILCANVHQLNTFFFFDSINHSLEKVSICQIHSDEILKMMLEEIKSYQRNVMKLYNQIGERKYNQKHFDLAFDNSGIYAEIESDKDKINRLRWQFCRWPICENRKFFYDEKIFSCIVFSTHGKLRHIFYFHKKCWDSFKARCGINNIITTGQKTLNMI